MTDNDDQDALQSQLNHFNPAGHAHMVDVGHKDVTRRRAVATGSIRMLPETLQRIISGEHKKGDVLSVARVAGIMACKRTAELIPLCHPLALTHIDIEFETDDTQSAVVCRVTAETNGQTGVEMEALTATQIALLTIYDMCKAVDRGMVITDVCLLQKSGGKSGLWER